MAPVIFSPECGSSLPGWGKRAEMVSQRPSLRVGFLAGFRQVFINDLINMNQPFLVA